MADPLSISVSVLAVITAAIKSTKSLHATVERFKNRDSTLSRLHRTAQRSGQRAQFPRDAVESQTEILSLIEGPVKRCSDLCDEFNLAMEKFNGKPRMGLIDWTRMEFKKGDIRDFTETLASYKATILISLGTITTWVSCLVCQEAWLTFPRRHTKVTRELLEKYDGMIQDTVHQLRIHAQRIDEQLARMTSGSTSDLDTSIDLQDEQAVTRQCIRICQDAKSYLESLQRKQSPVLQAQATQNSDPTRPQFEAQRLTSQTMNEQQDKFLETLVHLQNRLNTLLSNDNPNNDHERAVLKEDIAITNQCLEVCRHVSQEIRYQKYTALGKWRQAMTPING